MQGAFSAKHQFLHPAVMSVNLSWTKLMLIARHKYLYTSSMQAESISYTLHDLGPHKKCAIWCKIFPYIMCHINPESRHYCISGNFDVGKV